MRREEINNFAEDVRAALSLEIPLDLTKTIELLGGDLEEYNEKYGLGAEAYVRKTEESFAVAIANDYNVRNRFSIAHEIGHLFLHLGYLIDDELWNASSEGYVDSVRHRVGHNEEEYEANEFAAALLMPKKSFESVARQHLTGNTYNVSKIAEYFDVSIDAARNRGRWLGIFSW